VFLNQKQFNSLSKIRLPIPQLIILGFFFIIASCSTQGPSRTAETYPDEPKRYGEQRDHKFDYRKDRLSTKEKPVEPLDIQPPLESIADLKGFTDDMDPASLGRAIDNQLAVMFEQDPASPVRLGDFTLTRGRLVETLEAFQKLLQKNLPQEEFNKKVSDEFLLYRVGKGKNKKVLFTGYYRPVITASPTPSARYRFPLYQMPEKGFQSVKKQGGIRLVGSNSGIKQIQQRTKNWRNLTREEIDRKGALSHQGLEVAWLDNELERYFLHIQGSGVLEFPDGTRQGIRYQGSNSYSYNSIGKKMIRDGVITTSQGSMQEIKKYFANNPQNISKYLSQNKRYIFFSLSDEGAIGSGGGELVGGRSIATDKSIYPAGGLVFVKVRQPVLDANNKIKYWKPISRFVIDQDTGSAIRGKARADLYFGTGKKAGAKAGHYHEKGEVYYLIKKS
jgi:membrane-bound lytic murein transglycosylase A